MLEMANQPEHPGSRVNSWGSWISASTCSSWHSTDTVPLHQALWANPGTSPTWLSNPSDAPLSLPVDALPTSDWKPRLSMETCAKDRRASVVAELLDISIPSGRLPPNKPIKIPVSYHHQVSPVPELINTHLSRDRVPHKSSDRYHQGSELLDIPISRGAPHKTPTHHPQYSQSLVLQSISSVTSTIRDIPITDIGDIYSSSIYSADDNAKPDDNTIKNDENTTDGRVCGSLTGGPLTSLALALPSKLEGLLKLFAQSLHLVLTAMCTRKAKRKDRDCSAAQEQEHKLYLEKEVLERKIPETDLRQLVELPAGLGYEEWLASHTIDFFQHINLLYGTIYEYCTMSGCPDMSGPATKQYLWFDEKGKKTRVAAPQYIDYVMTFTQKTINDESIFPTKFENDFPVSFESIVKKIHRLLFHVVAHLYHSHFREMVLLSLHSHLNCIFAHFILFNDRFGLIDDKETEILHDLVVALKLHPPQSDDGQTTQTEADAEGTGSGSTIEGMDSQVGVSPAGAGTETGSQDAGGGELLSSQNQTDMIEVQEQEVIPKEILDPAVATPDTRP